MAQLQEKSQKNLELFPVVNTTHLQYCNVDLLMPGKALHILHTVVGVQQFFVKPALVSPHILSEARHWTV